MSFPANPSVAQQATEGGRLYQWSGSAWDLVANVSGHAAMHGSGGSDPIAIASSQVTDFAAAVSAAAPPYSLPAATASILGGVKAGSNVTIDGSGVLSVAAPVTSLPYSSITGTPALAAVAVSGSASDLTSGTVGAARLGSGTADSTTFLRGDGSWATPAGGSSESIHPFLLGGM